MIEQTTPGMNIYYRGYVIHEDIRRIHYTIYGTRPHRMEMTSVGNSREAMRWVDRHIADKGLESLMVWPTLFATGPQPAATASW